jgi:hypothetical protein
MGVGVPGVDIGQSGDHRQQPDGREDPTDDIAGAAGQDEAADDQVGREHHPQQDLLRVAGVTAVGDPQREPGGVAEQAEDQQPPGHPGRTVGHRCRLSFC